MKPAINSGIKGKRYELDIAKILSVWAGFKLIRTPMSGAWAGTSGDILPQGDEDFPFLVECKKQEQWDMDAIFAANSAIFRGWIAQVWREVGQDAEITGTVRFPLLIFSRNRKPNYVLFPNVVELASPADYGDFSSILKLICDKQHYAIVLLEEFIELDYTAVKSYAQGAASIAHAVYKSYGI